MTMYEREINNQSINQLAAILVIRVSVGVAPEMNLRNPLHTGDRTCKGFFLAIKPWENVTSSLK